MSADRGLPAGTDNRSGNPSGEGPGPERASLLREAWSVLPGAGPSAGGGVERGRAGADAPAEPPAWERGDEGLAAAAERLAERLRRVLPGEAVAVQLSSAEVAAGGRTRRVESTRVLLGPDPRLALWTRTFPGLPPEGDPPWLAPLAREAASRRLPWSAAAPPAGPAVLDAFAAADLLRAAAQRWLGPAFRPGDRVLPAGLDVDDPGSPFGGPAAAAVDDEGTPERPLAAVRDGILLGRPRALADERAGRGRSTGSAVAYSWRTPPAAAWRSLVLCCAETRPLPGRVPLVTRVLLLPGEAVLFGHVPGAGRFGPWPAGAPDDLLACVRSACGPPVTDAVGVPVTVPPLLLEPPGWRPPPAAW